MRLRFPHPPRTLVPVDGLVPVWEATERTERGIYLWCFEIDGLLWVNYVGKTSSQAGFRSRLWTEFKDWKAGRYLPPPVDIDALLRGERVGVNERTPEHLTRELAVLVPRCRILMAPLASKDECLFLEGAVVNTLRRNPTLFSFLANRDKARGYRRGRDVTLEVESVVPIAGLTTPSESVDEREG